MGVGRGSDRELPATGLARFSLHPQLHLSTAADAHAIAAAVSANATQMQHQSALVTAAVNAGWDARAHINGNLSWVMLTKLFAEAREAAQELQSLGADDIQLDFFPSGDIKKRGGYMVLGITASNILVFPRRKSS
jgi:hypothetical protein